MSPLLFAAAAALTYAAHSAVACAIALVAARVVRRPHDRDVIWKTALVAPIATTALALLQGRLRLFATIDVAELIRREAARPLPGRDIMVHLTRGPDGQEITRRLTDPVASTFALVTLAACAVVVMVAGARALRRWHSRSRRLANRRPLPAGSGSTLSASDAIPSPVAIGRSEICLPTRVVDEFSPAHRDALIAHERAHLARRDPFWFAAVDAITALTAFQPLVFIVARAFRRDVELVCDESAVRVTGDRVSLVGALALLAAPFDAAAPLGAVSAYDGGPLVARAERIASVATTGRVASTRRAILVAACAAGALSLLPVVAPAPDPRDIPLPSLDAVERGRMPMRKIVMDSAGRRIERRRIIVVR